MRMEYQAYVATAVAFTAILFYYGFLSTFLYVVVHVMVIVIAVYYVTKWQLNQGRLYKPQPTKRHVNLTAILLQKMMEKQSSVEEISRKVVISRSLDNTIQNILDLIVHDFVLSWYSQLAQNQQRFVNSLQADVWYMIEELSKRLSKVDFVKVFTEEVVDLLHNHYLEIRNTSRKDIEKSERPTFVLHPWLRDEESEVGYLRKICEVLLLCLLPPCYKKCHTIRHLLREILTSSVLKPTIDTICNPDHINLKLLNYLEYREKVSEDTRRTYTYAATYEDFVKKIELCEDMEHLKQMRYTIMSEIMHATTINNLKKAEGIKTASNLSVHEKESSPKSTTKGELLKARNLKRYINQLTVAKARCEKRIQGLGGPDYKYYGGGSVGEGRSSSPLPGQKVLSFSVIMDLTQGREYFMKYLKKENQESLLGFWTAVEKLRSSSRDKRHHVASEIYQQYISSASTSVTLDKATIKGMEIFLVGDKGPESFYDAQNQMYSILEKKYYPSFIVSDVYHQCISYLEEEDNLPATMSKDELFLESKDDIDPSENTVLFADESYHAQQKLQQLDERLANKYQALQAVKSSQKPDEKTKILEEGMEQEVEKFRDERRKLESHIARTQLWIDHQGSWMAQVHNAEASQSGTDRITPSFILVIYLRGSQPGSQELQNSSQGWVVSRSLDDFYALHEKLVQIGPWLKKKDMPSVGMTFFKSIDATFLEKAKKTLNDYLMDVMRNELMTQSEALYAFLTPSPEFLIQPSMQKRNKFSLVNLIKSLPNIRSSENQNNDDEFLFLGDESSKEDHSRDSIAKPLYRLMNEVFELRGTFKWLRKSFIAFVEISFGRSINRQLRETIDWVFSESMLIYYLNTFKDSMWPDGQLAKAAKPRTDEQKLETRMEAKQKILENIPDALKNLVGDDNARHGTIKMFESLQDTRLNKQIVYNLLEVLMLELCPELQQIKARYEPQSCPPGKENSTIIP